MILSELFIKGFIAHHIADWFLQNEWMALNKATLSNPLAGLVHMFIHCALSALVFPYPVAFYIALSHWFIDLRFGLAWWRKWFHQTTEGPFAIHVAIWQDQVAHWVVIYLAAWWCAR